MQRSKIEIGFIIFFSLVFIALNSLFAYKQSFILSSFPFLLLAGFWVFFAPDKLFFALALFVPISIPLRRIIPGLNFDFWLPTEPILVFLLVMVILKSFKENFFEKELLKHPVFISMLFFLGWLIITIATSEMPIVSLKYFLVRFWYIGIFFYLAFIIFKQNPSNINRYLWAYIIGISAVCAISIFKQVGLGLLNHKAAHGASAPFFVDHTSYGAALALIIPNSKNWIIKALTLLLTGFLMVALLLSYSRAAWLSLIIGAGVWVLILLRIRFRSLVITGVLLAAVFFTFQDEIIWRLQRNTTDSSGDIAEHVQSIFNVSTDASNLERINRWDAAIAMFKERPVFGWGPGTYQFVYAPFQMSYNKTIISTNFGTGGNAHSEYLGLMSEAGLPSVLAFIMIWLLVLIHGLLLIKRKNLLPSHRNIIIACIVGLVTYITHGFLNNFLDMDKIAALFWGYMAIILALESIYKKVERLELEELEKLETTFNETQIQA